MKIGDIVSTPDGLGEIVIVEEIDHRERQLFHVVLDSSRPDDPVKKYYRNELKLVYSPK